AALASLVRAGLSRKESATPASAGMDLRGHVDGGIDKPLRLERVHLALGPARPHRAGGFQYFFLANRREPSPAGSDPRRSRSGPPLSFPRRRNLLHLFPGRAPDQPRACPGVRGLRSAGMDGPAQSSSGPAGGADG